MTTIPTFQVTNLTPELARELLAGQAPNRNKKWVKIDQFARNMKAGLWTFTGEAIKFDWNGRMIDGQNRCEAVIKSGVTIQVLVIRGLDPTVQGDMDQVTPRSSRDALKFAGYEDTKDVSAAISAHRAWKDGAIGHCMANLSYYSRPSNSEAVLYAAQHPELVAAAKAAQTIYSHGLRLPIGAIAVALVETAAIDAAASKDFFDRIINLRTTGPGDPVHTLLKRIDAIRSVGHRVELSMAMYLLFRTWNAYRDGEHLTKFQVGAPAREQGAKATWAKIPEPK